MKLIPKRYLIIVSIFVIGIFLTVAAYSTLRFHEKNKTPVSADSAKSEPIVRSPQEMLKELSRNSPQLGSPNAPIQVVEFADFQCPYCEQFYATAFNQINDKYVKTGKVKFIFADAPIIGEESTIAARGGKCADEQGKFWDYYNYLFQHQKPENNGNLRTSNLKKIALQIGLDGEQFDACLDSQKYASEVSDELKLFGVLGITGTPGFVINDQVVSGYKAGVIQGIIDKELKSIDPNP
ncbi:MAG: thioredoxin domain-containing protein [Candidatus Doudnabacteria bacterium]